MHPFNIYSWWGIVWVHLVTGTIAIKVVLLVPPFGNLNSSFEEASRMCGVDTPRHVLPRFGAADLPAIVIVTLMSVAASLQAFEVELILGPRRGIDVYSTIMYRFIGQEPAQFGPATALGVLVMLAMLPFALWQYRSCRDAKLHDGHRQPPNGARSAGALEVAAVRARSRFILCLRWCMPTVLLVLATFMKFFGAFDAPEPWTLRQWRSGAHRRDVPAVVGQHADIGRGALPCSRSLGSR